MSVANVRLLRGVDAGRRGTGLCENEQPACERKVLHEVDGLHLIGEVAVKDRGRSDREDGETDTFEKVSLYCSGPCVISRSAQECLCNGLHKERGMACDTKLQRACA
jgi:hypothetical protein